MPPRRLKGYLSHLILFGDRPQRKIALMLIDLVVFSVSLYFAIAIRFESLLPVAFFIENSWKIFAIIPLQLIVFRTSGIYRSILRYSSLNLLRDASKAVVLSTAILIFLTYFSSQETLSRSILIINTLVTLVLVVYVRMGLRWLIRQSLSHSKQRQLPPGRDLRRLLVYGAGGAGAELLQALSHSPYYKVVGFVDDNLELQRKASLEGLTIYAPQQLPALHANGYFDSVVLAMPSASSTARRRVVEKLQKQAIAVKTVPPLAHILSGKVTINELQDVNVSALLGREEVSPDLELLKRQISGKAILVTGAGGSIGSELCRQIAQQQPSCLVLYERNEFALYKIHQELSENYRHLKTVPCLGSVTDGPHLRSILRQYQVKTVYHAAAYKHVPLLESNIAKGIENNVLGTLIAAQSAIESSVSQFVLISTDKAVRPTNIMGTTKRVAELTIQALAAHPQPQHHPPTRFAIVRFGNVLGSSGSVVPRFRKQIAQGGPITLTHREITRYFMSIPEAARLVIQAGAMSEGGEVFLLDMGEPVKIYDLAARMITLSGLIPEQDIEIEVTGLRPGEKLYEELLISGDDVRSTYHPKIYCGQENFLSWETLSPQLTDLFNKVESNNIALAKSMLKLLVPEYSPQSQSDLVVQVQQGNRSDAKGSSKASSKTNAAAY